MIYHYLAHSGYRAAAEMMAECYERRDTKSLENYKPRSGAVLQRATVKKGGTTLQLNIPVKPNPEFEDTKKKLRDRIQEMADESAKKNEEMMQREETVSEEDVDEEEEQESSNDEKSSQSSTSTAESEVEMVTSNWTRRLWGPNAHQLSTDTIIATASPPSRPSQLPPLVSVRPKPQLTSIRSIDFDIPQLEKSPSIQSIETPRASPSPVAKEDVTPSKASPEDSKASPKE
ncbi:hypothetical protein OSTOST_15440, partial [Ostertagia ostertagi]